MRDFSRPKSGVRAQVGSSLGAQPSAAHCVLTMINLIATNGLAQKKQFLGLYCNVSEAQQHAQIRVEAVGHMSPLEWVEAREGGPIREAFMTGTLLPVSVLQATYNDFTLVILDYGF